MLNALNGYMTAHGVPLWMQPIVIAFLCSMPVWLALAIWEQRLTGGEGATFQPKTWQVTIFFCALFYVRNYTERGRLILTWPDQHLPYWHEHWWQIVIGGIVAGLIAKQIGKLYGRMRARSSRQPQAGFQVMPGETGWYSHNSIRERWEE